MRFKIKGEHVEREHLPTTSIKAMRAFDDYDSRVLAVLGAPFGGPVEGRDSDGEAFNADTDFMLSPGDERPVTYYHGFGPDDPADWQNPPVIIGKCQYVGEDSKGGWFNVKLDTNDPLAKRILDARMDTVRASSGAVSHMVRMAGAGVVSVWPIGELAIFDTNEFRQPANDYAIVNFKTESKGVSVSKTEPVDGDKVVENISIENETTENEKCQTNKKKQLKTTQSLTLLKALQIRWRLSWKK